ncbi:MAG TPA: hypothetical protein PLV92_25540, partial [Pirellulaceae bacterium]|nr:hypothetical protein [Pirellulaceae bacterium]
GPDVVLNPTINANEQDEGYISMNRFTGEYCVTWSDRQGNDGFQMGCGARFFHADGTPFGLEQIINTTWNFSQFEPHCAASVGGRVLTAWSDAGIDGSCGVVARLFDKTGVPLSGEVLVNTPDGKTQIDPSVACDLAGNFVVAFVDASGKTGEPRDILARRFDANLNPLGLQFLVNSDSTGLQREPDIAMDAAGDFVVVWQDESGVDGSGFGVFGRRFDKNGVGQGPQFVISVTTAGDQKDPSVAMDYVGNFVCTWEDNSSGNYDVKIRRFDRFGVPLSGDLTMNTILGGDQQYAKTAMSQSGQRLFPIWIDHNADDDYGTLLELKILEANPPLTVGVTSTLSMELPGEGGMPYVLLAALSTSPAIPVGLDRVFRLAPDALFQFFAAFPSSSLGSGYAGVLDAQGRASATFVTPNQPSLINLPLYFAPAWKKA